MHSKFIPLKYSTSLRSACRFQRNAMTIGVWTMTIAKHCLNVAKISPGTK